MLGYVGDNKSNQELQHKDNVLEDDHNPELGSNTVTTKRLGR